jgi:hypothetical protein
MAYVIAEPCIGVKDTSCVDACLVDCIHPKKNTTYEDGAAPVFPCVLCRPYFLSRIYPRSGSSTRS